MRIVRNVVVLSALLCVGTMQAQSLTTNNQSPEVVAKSKVSLIHDELSLTGDQQASLYEAYVLYESNIAKHIADKDPNSPAVIKEKNKLETALKQAVESNLTANQFMQWLELDM